LTIVLSAAAPKSSNLSELQQLLKTEVRVEDVVVDLKEVRLGDRRAVQISC